MAPLGFSTDLRHKGLAHKVDRGTLWGISSSLSQETDWRSQAQLLDGELPGKFPVAQRREIASEASGFRGPMNILFIQRISF